MRTSIDKTKETESKAAANASVMQQSKEQKIAKLDNSRPEAVTQKKLQESANNSEQVNQLKNILKMANDSRQLKQLRTAHEKACSCPDCAGRQTSSLQNSNVSQLKVNNTSSPSVMQKKSGTTGCGFCNSDNSLSIHATGEAENTQARSYGLGVTQLVSVSVSAGTDTVRQKGTSEVNLKGKPGISHGEQNAWGSAQAWIGPRIMKDALTKNTTMQIVFDIEGDRVCGGCCKWFDEKLIPFLNATSMDAKGSWVLTINANGGSLTKTRTSTANATVFGGGGWGTIGEGYT